MRYRLEEKRENGIQKDFLKFAMLKLASGISENWWFVACAFM